MKGKPENRAEHWGRWASFNWAFLRAKADTRSCQSLFWSDWSGVKQPATLTVLRAGGGAEAEKDHVRYACAMGRQVTRLQATISSIFQVAAFLGPGYFKARVLLLFPPHSLQRFSCSEHLFIPMESYSWICVSYSMLLFECLLLILNQNLPSFDPLSSSHQFWRSYCIFTTSTEKSDINPFGPIFNWLQYRVTILIKLCFCNSILTLNCWTFKHFQ